MEEKGRKKVRRRERERERRIRGANRKYDLNDFVRSVNRGNFSRGMGRNSIKYLVSFRSMGYFRRRVRPWKF